MQDKAFCATDKKSTLDDLNKLTSATPTEKAVEDLSRFSDSASSMAANELAKAVRACGNLVVGGLKEAVEPTFAFEDGAFVALLSAAKDRKSTMRRIERIGMTRPLCENLIWRDKSNRHRLITC